MEDMARREDVLLGFQVVPDLRLMQEEPRAIHECAGEKDPPWSQENPRICRLVQSPIPS